MDLNIIPNGAIKRVHISQNDVGRTLTFELFNNSTSYTVPSGATVKIQGTKPSGFGFSETCTVSGNTVTIDTTEAMTDEYGYIETELQITNSGNVLGTSNFILAVEKNPHPSNTTDGTQITAQSLQVQIDDLDTRVTTLESDTSGGLTDDIKQALLNCFAHVAWIDEHGQDYYDELENALYPPADLLSISAVYTQSGTVYDTDSLDDLKADLVVTAHYSDSTTQTVSGYTLSGTLEEGTSTITVIYGGQTTTFTVTVTHATTQYTITNTLTNCTNSNNASVINELASYSATLTANTNYELTTVTITMGGTDVTSTVYDDSDSSISISSVTGNIVITAEAVEDLGYESGVPYTFTLTDGYAVDGTSYELVESSGMSYVELPCKGVDYIERYWSSFGGTFRMDFYDENDTHLQAATLTTTGTIGFTVDKNATKVIVSGTTGRMQNLVVTPYRYPELGENTVWSADTIYTPESATLSETTLTTNYMFCALAETVSVAIGYATSNTRGRYYFYEQSKTLISSTSTAEIIGGTGIWRTPVEIPSGTYYVKVELYNISDVNQAGNAFDNFRVVLDRVVE